MNVVYNCSRHSRGHHCSIGWQIFTWAVNQEWFHHPRLRQSSTLCHPLLLQAFVAPSFASFYASHCCKRTKTTKPLPESQVRRYWTQLPSTVPNSNIILNFKRSEDGLVCFSVAYWPSPCTSTCRLWQHQALLPTLPDRPAQRTHNQNWLGNMQNKCRRKLCQGNYNKTYFLRVLRLSHWQEISIQAKVHSGLMHSGLMHLWKKYLIKFVNA